jgi:hypothetical protein
MSAAPGHKRSESGPPTLDSLPRPLSRHIARQFIAQEVSCGQRHPARLQQQPLWFAGSATCPSVAEP